MGAVRWLLLVVLSSSVGWAQDQATWSLRYNLRVGQKWMVRTVLGGMKFETVIGAGTVDSTMDSERWERWEVVDVDEKSVATIQVTLSRFSGQETAGREQVTRYTTATEDVSAPDSALYRTLVGRSYYFAMDPAGQVLAVRGVAQIVNAVATQATQIISDPALRARVTARIGRIYNDEYVRQAVSSRLPQYSGQAIRAGQPWVSQLRTSADGGTVAEARTTTLLADRTADGNLRFTVVGTGAYQPTNPNDPILIEARAESKGAATIDPSSGFPTMVSLRMDLKGSRFRGPKQPTTLVAEYISHETVLQEFMPIR